MLLVRSVINSVIYLTIYGFDPLKVFNEGFTMTITLTRNSIIKEFHYT